MTSNYIIVHGSFGSPFVNWIPWLRKEIEERGKIVYTPDFPTGVGYQNYENWSRLFKSYVDAGIIGEDTVIFAHSIAPIFLCKFLVENAIKVKRLVFVCGFNHYYGIDDDYDTVNGSMYFDELENVKKYCHDIVCFYTENDPYVAYSKEEEFASVIADKNVIIPDGGHLNADSGYECFPELLNYL